MVQNISQWYKVVGALLIMIDVVVGTFIFINLIVAVAANTLVGITRFVCYSDYN